MKKHVILLVSVLALSSVVKAQSSSNLSSPVGIGTNSPTSDLHIHEATLSPYNQGFEPLEDGLRDDPVSEGYYSTTLRLTNGLAQTGFRPRRDERQVAAESRRTYPLCHRPAETD